jgi:hypothetical protein
MATPCRSLVSEEITHAWFHQPRRLAI